MPSKLTLDEGQYIKCNKVNEGSARKKENIIARKQATSSVSSIFRF